MAEMTSAVADGRTHIHPAALLGMHTKAEINTIRRRGPNNMVAMGLNWVIIEGKQSSARAGAAPRQVS